MTYATKTIIVIGIVLLLALLSFAQIIKKGLASSRKRSTVTAIAWILLIPHLFLNICLLIITVVEVNTYINGDIPGNPEFGGNYLFGAEIYGMFIFAPLTLVTSTIAGRLFNSMIKKQ